MPATTVMPSTWKKALTGDGRKWRDIGVECPAPGTYGLVALHFDDDGPAGHAVAIWNDGQQIKAFDNLSARWLKLGTWEAIILPLHLFAARLDGGQGKCWIHSVIEVERS